jgi:hypothetical protein
MVKSSYPYHPAESSASSPRRKCSHSFEDFMSNREHPAHFKHDEEEDWHFISNEVKAGSSSIFDSSAFKNNYYPPHLVMAPLRLFSTQTTQKHSSSPPLTNKNPQVVPHHVPSFHPIADADNAIEIPIDLSHESSDHLLMDPFFWGNEYHGAFDDPTPFQEQGMRIPQEPERDLAQQEDEIDPLPLFVSTFLPEDQHEPNSFIRRVSLLKREHEEDGDASGAPEQQRSDAKKEGTISPSPPSKKPRLISPSPVKIIKQSDVIKKTSNKKKNKKISATRKMSFDGVSSGKKVASSSKATIAAPNKKNSSTRITVRFRTRDATDWMDHLAEAAEYQKKYGHCVIHHDYPPNQQLARWAKRQRHQYKRYKCGKHSTMTQERVKALENLDFCWDAHKETWNARYEELRQFKMCHGHSSVPTAYAAKPKLATWVKCQRRQYKLSSIGKHSSMVPDRLRLLEKLNFVWECVRDTPKNKKK